jgi:hypothetical protein
VAPEFFKKICVLVVETSTFFFSFLVVNAQKGLLFLNIKVQHPSARESMLVTLKIR